jgi:hypothetical protein
MTTLPLHASHAPNAPHIWSGFARVAAAFTTVLDVFVEARQQAIAAQERYPFATW